MDKSPSLAFPDPPEPRRRRACPFGCQDCGVPAALVGNITIDGFGRLVGA